MFICETNGGGWVQLELVDTWEDEIDDIIRLFEKQHKRRLIYTICFYWCATVFLHFIFVC